MKTRANVAWCVVAAALAWSCGPAGDNTPPDLGLSPSGPDLSVTIGKDVTITAFAEDVDGDDLELTWTVITDNELSTLQQTASFITTSQSETANGTSKTATFRWLPDSADITSGDPIRLIFVVTDSAGNRTEREKRISVIPGNGRPEFTSSANQLYTECCDKPLVFDVSVVDADESEVEITMSEAPAGAQFDQIGAFKGRFTWTPQGNDGDKRIHSAKFSVNDGDNGTVDQLVTIVIPPDDLGGGGGGNPAEPEADLCVGERLIEHNPLGAQREPRPTIDINAQLGPGTERYDKAILFWAEGDPVSNPNTTVFSTDMERMGSTITGTLPNLSVTEGGERLMSYAICLIDSQAGEQDPAATVCNPTVNELFFAFTTYADSGASCFDDGVDVNRGDDTRQTANPVSDTGWDTYTACGGDDDFHSIAVRPGQSFALVAAYPFGADLDVELLDVTGTPVPGAFERSDCTGLAIAEIGLDADASATNYFVKVSGDDVVYYMSAFEYASGVGCDDEDLEPNPDSARAVSLPEGTTTELGICPDSADEDVYAIELDYGEALTVTMTHPSAAANLDMTLYSPTQADFPDLNGVAFTFSLGQDEEVLEYESRHCGTHYLRVFSNDAGANYELDIQKAAGGSCTDDDSRSAADCNHVPENASLFPWNQELAGLKLCDGGEDWYRHRGNASYILGSVTVTEGSGSPDFEIYDIDGNKLAEADSEGVLEYTFTDDDTYYFRVASDETITYSLEVLQ